MLDVFGCVNSTTGGASTMVSRLLILSETRDLPAAAALTHSFIIILTVSRKLLRSLLLYPAPEHSTFTNPQSSRRILTFLNPNPEQLHHG